MSDEGWTICDLVGELMERGIDIDDISDGELWSAIHHRTPERAADDLYRQERGDE